MKNEIIELAKKLVSIPSYVDGKINERKIGEFVYDYLLGNCPWLKVKKQKVKGERFNVIATDGYPVKLLVCGHLDTVIPKSDWKLDPLKPIVENNKLYGLGALDMKGSSAALLVALKNLKTTKGLLALFYIDEEYDFLGMRKFVSDYEFKGKPKLILSIDGGDLKIGYGCRGKIDLDFEVIGKSGHAALPDSGVNAILAAAKAVEGLSRVLKTGFGDPILGPSVCNLASLETDNKSRNVIPGKALAKLDIRPAKSKLKGQKVVKLLKPELRKQKAKLGNFKILNDLGPMIANKESLSNLEEIVKDVVGKTEYLEPKEGGYGDVAMLYEKYKMPTASFGPSPIKMAHQANEYVLIGDLEKCAQVFAEVIKRYCT